MPNKGVGDNIADDEEDMWGEWKKGVQDLEKERVREGEKVVLCPGFNSQAHAPTHLDESLLKTESEFAVCWM